MKSWKETWSKDHDSAISMLSSMLANNLKLLLHPLFCMPLDWDVLKWAVHQENPRFT